MRETPYGLRIDNRAYSLKNFLFWSEMKFFTETKSIYISQLFQVSTLFISGILFLTGVSRLGAVTAFLSTIFGYLASKKREKSMLGFSSNPVHIKLLFISLITGLFLNIAGLVKIL